MSRFEDDLLKLRESSNLRRIPDDGSLKVDLVSNDYMGLGARCKEFIGEFFSSYPGLSFSSSASRLLSRRQHYHNLLEEELNRLYGKHSLLFNSGYHANVGILSALSSPSSLFLVDEMMHASGHDGLMLGRSRRNARVAFFPHNDMDSLVRLLADERKENPGSEVIIVTEGIFSMDGDLAPLNSLVELKRKYPGVMLYLDEAHSFGVRGKRGLGLAEEFDLLDEIDIIIGTFGKAAASSGAFVATSGDIRDFLVNRSRSFIFSTALPPVNVAWSHFMLSKLTGMERERACLRDLSRNFAKIINTIPGQNASGVSQIIPVHCGSAEKAVEWAGKLRDGGFDALPIRRPTVPPGKECIRLSLSASLTLKDLSPIPQILTEK